MKYCITRRRFVADLGLSCLSGMASVHPALCISTQSWNLEDQFSAVRPKGHLHQLWASINKLPLTNGLLTIPNATYHFGKSDPKLLFDGFKNLTIDGGGSLLHFSGENPPLRFIDCIGVSLKQVRLSWDLVASTQGDIIDVDPTLPRITMRIDPGFPGFSASEVITIYRVDRDTGSPAQNPLEVGGRELRAVTQIRDRIWTLDFLRSNMRFSSGDTLVLKLKNRFSAPAISFERCKNVTVHDVSLSLVPQMALVAHRVQNMAISQFQVGKTSTHRRLFASSDGIHLSDMSGTVTLTNCSLSELADDGLNCHTFYFKIAKLVDARTVLIAPKSDFLRTELGLGQISIKVGDRIQISETNTLQVQFTASVRSVVIAPDGVELTLDRDFSYPQQGSSLLVCSTTEVPTLTIRGCKVARSRARGMLVHSNAVIENCEFDNLSLSGVLMEADGAVWGEGCEVNNVRIVNNTFRSCGSRLGAAISAQSLISAQSGFQLSHFRTVSNIEILDNHIEHGDGPMIDISGGSDIIISGNRFSRRAGKRDLDIINLNSSNFVNIIGNGSAQIGKVKSTRGAKSIVVKENQNLEKSSNDD
jgi:hypothetical protein